MVSRLTRAQARRSAGRSAGHARGRRHPRRALRATGKSATGCGALVARLGLEDRVTFAGPHDRAQLLDHLARCRAVCFPPFEEDYGFVTVEAFASRKAVITCRDSGGPAELVEDGVSGFVCEPTPQSLAARCGA